MLLSCDTPLRVKKVGEGDKKEKGRSNRTLDSPMKHLWYHNYTEGLLPFTSSTKILHFVTFSYHDCQSPHCPLTPFFFFLFPLFAPFSSSPILPIKPRRRLAIISRRLNCPYSDGDPPPLSPSLYTRRYNSIKRSPTEEEEKQRVKGGLEIELRANTEICCCNVHLEKNLFSADIGIMSVLPKYFRKIC